MSRKHYEMEAESRSLQLGDRTLIAGVLNVTPDSFSDGGQYLDPDRAFAHALHLEEQGADIIDIGAERRGPVRRASTRRRNCAGWCQFSGGSAESSAFRSRRHLQGIRGGTRLGIGAEIINDPSSLTLRSATR